MNIPYPSSIRPFVYEGQQFPPSGAPGTNVSGVMKNIPASGLGTSGSMFVTSLVLGQSWFNALAELRSLPGGHPSGDGGYSSRAKGIIHFGSAVLGTHPYDLPDTVVYDIKEPSRDGTEFVTPPSGFTSLSGLSSHMQLDVFQYYVQDLRDMHTDIFTLMANDYRDATISGMRSSYLEAYFPHNSGQYNDPSGPSGFYYMDLAEVQYNPYPRVAGDPQPEWEWWPGFYGSRLNKNWQFYTGNYTYDTEPPANEDFHSCFDNFRYFQEIPASEHGTFMDYDYMDFMTYNSNQGKRSSPSYIVGEDEYLPYDIELKRKYSTIDAMGPVFPACQRLDGTLTPAAPSEGLFADPPTSEWWRDGPSLGKESGTYTLDNQRSPVYNKWSDPFITVTKSDVDGDGKDGIKQFCKYYYYPIATAESPWGGGKNNRSWVGHGFQVALMNMRPVLYGGDPGDFLIGYMCWYAQDYDNTVRVDGQGLIPGKTRYRVIDPVDRTAGGWSGCREFNYYGTSSHMVQSGCREVHRDVKYRNSNAGVNWERFPVFDDGATYNPKIIHGYPSHSGEPSRHLAINELGEIGSGSYVPAPHDRRAWFTMPDLSSPDAGRGETQFIPISPILGERRNVMKIVVENDHYYIDGQGNSYPASGEYSIWPSDDLFQNGSGIGYHVMDKGIWLRKGPESCGMMLISPYNGQRLLFKRAEDGPAIWGQVTGEWRKEVRPNTPPTWPEWDVSFTIGYPPGIYSLYEVYEKYAWFRNPSAPKRTDITAWVRDHIYGSLYSQPYRWTGPNQFSPSMKDLYGNDVFDNKTTQAVYPASANAYGMYLRSFEAERGYMVSWYRDKEEQVPHTNGTYTIFNKAAQVVNESDKVMTRADYLLPDNKYWWYHDHLDPVGTQHQPLQGRWGTDAVKYPIITGYWHYYDGGNFIIGGGMTGGPGNDQIPDITFSIPELMFTPTLSQCSYHGSFQAQKWTAVNDYWNTDPADDGYPNLFCNVDIYIANKPYVQWDIPGLSIQTSGVATVDISNAMLQDLLTEGRLSPGFYITQASEWRWKQTWYKWLTWEKYQLVDSEDYPRFIATVQKDVAFDGYLALRLDMFGLQESSEGGIIEGWGKLVETGTGGITETPDPDKGGWPNDEPTNYVTGEPAYLITHEKPYHSVVTPELLPIYEQEAEANSQVAYWLYSVEYFTPHNMGYRSSPRFMPHSSDQTAIGGSYSAAGMYGSRLFRVWFSVDDPTTIHCVDDLYQSGRYGLLLQDMIVRYDITNRSGGRMSICRDTKEGLDFLPGMNPGDLPGWDPLLPEPGGYYRRAMNLDYKEAKRCPMSVTWIENNPVAAVALYDSDWGPTLFDNGRGFEIANLDISTGIFDNASANITIKEPGLLYKKQRPLLESRMWAITGSIIQDDPIWYANDPYQYEHWKYGNYYTAYNNPYTYYSDPDDYKDGLNPASIFAYASEVSDMWPKIVYTYI